jgi:hypothetical protein
VVFKNPGAESRPQYEVLRYGIAAAGAAASVFFLRSGFLGLFFLFPLGLVAFLGNGKTAWFGALLAVLGNLAVSVSVNMSRGAEPAFPQWNVPYHLAMVIIFTWINVPPRWLQRILPLRSVYRFALGALLGSLVMIPLFLSAVEDGELRDYIGSSLAAVNSLQNFSADELLNYTSYIGLRGGILVSCLVFILFNRQLAAVFARFVRRTRQNAYGAQQPAEGLISFHAGPALIWVFSLALGIVLGGSMGKIELIEIAGWNLLTLCGMIYLAQGIGIGLYFLVKLPPLLRIVVTIGVFFLFFRPGINMIFFISLILLGIVENWLPLRAAKQ